MTRAAFALALAAAPLAAAHACPASGCLEVRGITEAPAPPRPSDAATRPRPVSVGLWLDGGLSAIPGAPVPPPGAPPPLGHPPRVASLRLGGLLVIRVAFVTGGRP